jgi:hypothetical protein
MASFLASLHLFVEYVASEKYSLPYHNLDIITGGKYRQHPTKGYGHKKALQQTKGLSINMAATCSPALW